MSQANERHHVTPRIIERLLHRLRRTSDALDHKDWDRAQQHAEDLTAFLADYAPEIADCLTHLIETPTE
jgi:hypothetical protein